MVIYIYHLYYFLTKIKYTARKAWGWKAKSHYELCWSSSSVNLDYGQFKHRKIIALQNIITDYPKSFFKKKLIKYIHIN